MMLHNNARDALRVEAHTIPARDGYPLAASLFTSPRGDARAAVLVGSATGVPRLYYAKFARYLAARGLATVTFDYRGVGGSAPARLRGFRAKMSDWGALDLAGAIDWTQQKLGTSRLLYVGHSVAGQLLALAPNATDLHAAWLVGSQSGYWRLWDGTSQQAKLFAMWHAVLPAAVGVFGYFPSWIMGGGEDLPAGVAREWAAWGKHPRYITGVHPETVDAYARLTMPIVMVSVADDELAPRRAVDTLGSWFGRFPMRRVIHPGDVGAGEIGHFGYFRERFADTLWREAASWLVARANDAGHEEMAG